MRIVLCGPIVRIILHCRKLLLLLWKRYSLLLTPAYQFLALLNVSEINCNAKCSNSTQNCGGLTAMSVYTSGNASTQTYCDVVKLAYGIVPFSYPISTTANTLLYSPNATAFYTTYNCSLSASQPSTSVWSGWSYLGCFASGGTFTAGGVPFAPITNERCAMYCLKLGYVLSGSKSTTCYCGADFDLMSISKVSEASCNIACPGKSSEKCGGATSISVYTANALSGSTLSQYCHLLRVMYSVVPNFSNGT